MDTIKNKSIFFGYREIKLACAVTRSVLPVIISFLAINLEGGSRAEEGATIIVGDLETLPPFESPELLQRPNSVELHCPVPSLTGTAPADLRREDLIKELSDQRAALSQKWHAIKRSDLNSLSLQRRKPPIIASIDRELERAERHYADLHGRLDDQLSRLESVLRSRRNEPEQSEAPASLSVPSPTSVSKADPFLQPTTEISSPNLASVVEDADETSDTSLVPVTVTNQPVDQSALANNLYAVGQWQLALQIYEKLSHTEAPVSEQAWIQSQMAACYRKLGKTPEAERRYRTVAGRAEDDYMGENARWWLDTIQQRKELQQRVDQLEKTLEALQADSP